jgi:carbamoyl-phosphate synthase large subunit
VHASDVTLDAATRSPNLRRYVFASSYLTYDPRRYLFDRPPDEVVELVESAPLTPRNVCGAAKSLHEMEVTLAMQEPGCSFTAISARIFRVYGPDSRDVIGRWVRSALQGQPIDVYGEEGRFDYVYADDVAEGLVRLGDSQAGGAVNLATGRARSVGEVVSVLSRRFPDLSIRRSNVTAPYEASQASVERLRSITGWSPSIDVERGIDLLVAHEREHALSGRPRRRVLPPANLNVLITSIGAKAHIPREVRRAFKALNVTGAVWGGDTDPIAIARMDTDRFWEMPTLDQLPIETFIDFCVSNAIGLVIPSRDGELGYLAGHRERLGAAGVFVPIGSPDSVALANDKLLFARRMSEAGLDAIPTSEDLDEVVGDLVVVKPRHGAGSTASGIGVSRSDARRLAAGISDPIFQPFVRGTEFSVDVYVDRHGKTIGSVARERVRIVHGESHVTTVVHDEHLQDIAVRSVEAIGVRGHAVVQLIRSGAENVLLECNSRVGGASSAAWASGLRSVDAMVLEALGVEPEATRSPRLLTMQRSAVDLIRWR